MDGGQLGCGEVELGHDSESCEIRVIKSWRELVMDGEELGGGG